MKSWLQNNNIEMQSTYYEGKSVVVERFIKTFISRVYKYMISISQNVYIHKLDIVNEYNRTYQRAIKTKPVVVKDYI